MLHFFSVLGNNRTWAEILKRVVSLNSIFISIPSVNRNNGMHPFILRIQLLGIEHSVLGNLTIFFLEISRSTRNKEGVLPSIMYILLKNGITMTLPATVHFDA
ncbi:hypothetical protein CEXT_537051 [Caerostris extrusa]|uniref:Uncharacterized protein n=1 Tax=Caerostris extrusa TaxID=172846 RepID=A0AAV4N384_CAEEX|nr:hypothetical protein CEXT_537051 [Caerostris extrusa]